jgi:glycosyltransferase involved in cell wall biosynthesis
LLEVAGEGTAVATDPRSTDEIAAGLWRLLGGGPAVDSLRANGLMRAREFSWERCATEMFRVYVEATGEAVARPRAVTRPTAHGEPSVRTQV